MYLLIVIGLALFLAGCTVLPPDDFQSEVTARVAALTAKFNAFAGTTYAPPAVYWSDTPLQQGAVIGEGEASYTVVNSKTHVPTTYPENSITLNTFRANLAPQDLLNSDLPHELAHVFANRFYQGDQGHNGLWQRVFILLGGSRDDQDVTDPTLKAGGS